MPTCHLSDTVIRNFPAPDAGQVTHWDAGMPGFGLRISQGSSKTFVVVHGVERRRFTLGKYPTISLKQARDEAKKLQAGLTLGLIERKPSPMYTDALPLFLDASALKNRARTVTDYRRLLSLHFPFGRKRLNEISRADIQAKLNRLKDTPSEQRHAFVIAKIFFNWAVREEYLDASPIMSMQAPSRAIARERVLLSSEVVEILDKASTTPWPYGPIVELLALTGQRRGEIAGLRWAWINQAERLITLPGSFTKNRRTHAFPYGDMVHSILSSLPETGEYLFPGRTALATNFNGWGKCKENFDQTLDGVEPYVLHDLRRTFSSTMAQIGTPIHVTEKLLNHVSGTISGVAAIYNRHSYLGEMRAAIAAYDLHLGELLKGR